MPKPSLTALKGLKQSGEKIACLTAYDASFARQAFDAGVDVLLVGDSLGMVFQGQDTTLPVTLEDMIYHSAVVHRGSPDSLVITDLPFMSCNNPQQALASAGRLMKEGGAHIVKLEGATQTVLDSIRLMSEHGIPVCGHLGLLPQSVNKLGGYRVQGKSAEDAERILIEARALEEAGADMMVLECMPAELGQRISAAVGIPTIGIGAGADCDGQVLVIYDILGISLGKRPKFSKDFLAEAGTIPAALSAYVQAVKSGSFPAAEHCF